MARKKIKISTKKPIGYRISSIGAGGKEYNIRESKVWKKSKKK